MSHFHLYKARNTKKIEFNLSSILCFADSSIGGLRSRDIAGTAVSVMDFSVHLENKTELFCVDLKHFSTIMREKEQILTFNQLKHPV